MIKASPKPKTAFNAKPTFVLGVSLGSPSQEGKSLSAIVEAINKGSFSKGVIDLSDTLKRYGYMDEGMDEESAATRSIIEGDAWLDRNQSILERIDTRSLDIRRWSEWLNHPKYSDVNRLFHDLFDSCPTLSDAIDSDIKRFHARAHGTEKNIDPRSYELSRKFFLEELSAHALLYAEYNAVNIYPGRQLECFKVIRQGLVPKAPQSLVNSPYAKLVMHSADHVPALQLPALARAVA